MNRLGRANYICQQQLSSHVKLLFEKWQNILSGLSASINTATSRKEGKEEGDTAVGHHMCKTPQEGWRKKLYNRGSESKWVGVKSFDEIQYFRGALLRYSHDPRAGVSSGRPGRTRGETEPR